jgi:hypothetical protein
MPQAEAKKMTRFKVKQEVAAFHDCVAARQASSERNFYHR